jgi:hypothetical protein
MGTNGTRTRRVVLAAACVSGGLSAPEPSAYVEAYLTRVGFSTSEIPQMRAGSVVARVLPQKDDNAAFVVEPRLSCVRGEARRG